MSQVEASFGLSMFSSAARAPFPKRPSTGAPGATDRHTTRRLKRIEGYTDIDIQ
ncbi:MAG: hypothetical protein ACYTFA_10860 [Planctomycetota bacterium]|jgi:hypothetical protein